MLRYMKSVEVAGEYRELLVHCERMAHFTIPCKSPKHTLEFEISPPCRMVTTLFATLTLPLPSQSKHLAPFLLTHESAWRD